MTTLEELRAVRKEWDDKCQWEDILLPRFDEVFDLAEVAVMLEEMGPDLVNIFSAVGSMGITWQCGMASAAHGSAVAAIREAHATWKETSEP
ncbi:MAG TPA: hypothetical protein VFH61_14145 [Thermoleophilia bacterium]|nr:hypothetical protein [Thermoleophilia bacterium]